MLYRCLKTALDEYLIIDRAVLRLWYTTNRPNHCSDSDPMTYWWGLPTGLDPVRGLLQLTTTLPLRLMLMLKKTNSNDIVTGSYS